jgi:uncharacterized membrane protein (DUF4010 family)
MNSVLEGPLSRLGLALGIGLLIGLERGWRARDAQPGSRTAGVRTFAIIGLLGGVTGLLAGGADGALGVPGSILVGSAFLAFAAAFTLFSRDENQAAKVFSATTTIAGLLTFMLGVYAALGHMLVAAAAAVAAAGILMVREELHAWVRRLSLQEFQSVLVLLAMTFIALPVMPNRAVGPWGGVNPREIWIIAITLATISFAAFVAVRTLGTRRGVFVASALGGIVSSTAVIVANARAAAQAPAAAGTLAAGTALATTVSFIRVLAIIAVIEPRLLSEVAPALLAAAAAATLFAVVGGRIGSGTGVAQPELHLRNPFGFFTVVGVAVSMGVVLMLGRLVNEHYGSLGATIGAAVTGIFDVDAMTIAMARLVPQGVAYADVAQAILAGVAAATLGKIVVAVAVGGGRFRLLIAVMSVASVLAGALAAFAG